MEKKPKPEGYVFGRPTKYDPSMAEKAIELLREGASLAEVTRELNVSRDTITEWRKTKPDFSAAIQKGIELSQGWWEQIARKNLMVTPKGEQLNATLWYMNMKNRFGWRDKQDIALGGSEDAPPIKIDVGTIDPAVRAALKQALQGSGT